MVTRLRQNLPALLTLLLCMVPLALGQESGSGEESNPMTQYVLGGLAILVMFLYIRRRGKRKGSE